MHEDEKDTTGVSIHGGFPNPAADTSLGNLDLNQLLIQNTASTYIFRLRGDDWEDFGIYDGDVAIVDRALNPRKGDLVIWWNEQTDNFAISKYKNVGDNAQAWGTVTSVIHQFREKQS